MINNCVKNERNKNTIIFIKVSEVNTQINKKLPCVIKKTGFSLWAFKTPTNLTNIG